MIKEDNASDRFYLTLFETDSKNHKIGQRQEASMG